MSRDRTMPMICRYNLPPSTPHTHVPSPGSSRVSLDLGGKWLFVALITLLSSTSVVAQPLRPDLHPTPGKTPPRGSDRSAITALARDIDAILDDTLFADATWGVSIVSCDNNDRLYGHADRKNRQVASTMKLLTTATALQRLGGDYKMSTDMFISGRIGQNGELDGSVIVRASGDPSIAPNFGVNPQEVLQGWARALDSLGITAVRNIIVDAGVFDNIPYAPGWAWDDEPYGFNAQISGAAIYENSITVTVTPAKSPGRSVSIDIVPATSYVSLTVTAMTSRADSASTIDIRRERGSSAIVVSGNIAVDSEPYTETISIEQPPLFMATLLREELERAGIVVYGGTYDAADYHERLDYSLYRRVASHRSLPLRQIVTAINKLSLNLATEMLLKKLGREFLGVGSTAAGLEIVRKLLGSIGIEPDRIRLSDGSGLSRQDMISPADMTTFLKWMRGSSIAFEFLPTLPVAGRDGTLANRMRGTRAEGNVQAKTGYMSGVRAISGYARTRDGELLAFSIVANNYSVPTSLINTAQDLILMRIASFSRKG